MDKAIIADDLTTEELKNLCKRQQKEIAELTKNYNLLLEHFRLSQSNMPYPASRKELDIAFPKGIHLLTCSKITSLGAKPNLTTPWNCFNQIKADW